jgi:hypothetical protein
MPGIFRIGMTKKDINVKLNEANEYKEWKPPMLYKIEVAKKVKDPEDKYEKLKKILNKYRINQIQNFYKISLEEITNIFDLIEGEIWNEEKKEISLCRDMSKCFKDKQQIRHIIGTNIWIGYYDKYSNKIKYQNKRYKTDKKDKFSINFDIICYIIEKDSIKDINKIYNNILNNELIIRITEESKRRRQPWDLLNTLGKVLKFCKINMIFKSYIIIY